MSTLFPKILVMLLLMSALIAAVDEIFWRRARQASGQKAPMVIDYARSFLPCLLL